MKVQVKICGIQTVEDAKNALEHGANFIGLNFAPTSKRRISVEPAKKIIEVSKGIVKIVGIFQNQSATEVNKISKELSLDYVQLHGEETPSYCAQISTKIIKTFSLEPDFDPNKVLKSMKKYQVSYFLLDRKKQGEGEVLQPEFLKQIVQKHKVFTAGGLKVENIQQIVEMVKPFAVDVASGVETNGKIDQKKVKEFIKLAKLINY